METVELSECTYAHIKDTFYYGLFGNFKLVIDKSTGYFNATKVCAEGGKPFRQWKVLEKSKKMVEYYEENCRRNSDGNFLYEIKDANKDKIGKQVTGTYVPKELILDIASWISIKFYDKCNNIIINYFVNEFKKMDKNKLEEKIKQVEEQMKQLTLETDNVIKVKDDKIDELKEIMLRQEEERKKDRKIMLRQEQYMTSLGITLNTVKDQNADLLDKLEDVQEQNEDLTCEVQTVQRQVEHVQTKLNIAVEDRAPKVKSTPQREKFVLINKHCETEEFSHYVVRGQTGYCDRTVSRLRRNKFPRMTVQLELECQPNPRNLFIRFKEIYGPNSEQFRISGNNVFSNAVDETVLVEILNNLNDQKRNV